MLAISILNQHLVHIDGRINMTTSKKYIRNVNNVRIFAMTTNTLSYRRTYNYDITSIKYPK